MESPSVDLRYQMVGGFLRKVRKTFVFAVQIEKTEIHVHTVFFPKKMGNKASLKPVLTFQTLTLAKFEKHATTHERIFFLVKSCSWILLPGLI